VPLTPAHAAAVLPLHAAARRLGFPLPLSALVIGSLAPDFEYLFRLRPQGQLGQSALGLVVFCLPLGFGAWIAFRALVAPALLRLLPPGLAAALEANAKPAPGRKLVLLAAIALLLGAASHDVWDAFTHQHGWAVTRLSILRAPVAPALFPGFAWFKALQHGSTVIGLVTITLAAARWALRQPPAARRFDWEQAFRGLAVAAALVGAAALGAVANAARALEHGVAQALGFAAVGGMAALALALLAFGLTTWLGRPRL
jgi:hypothetical protein